MKLDEHIPGECYRVVAEILAWIYKAQLQAAKRLGTRVMQIDADGLFGVTGSGWSFAQSRNLKPVQL
jgi:hypothetical protein